MILYNKHKGVDLGTW